MIDWTELQSALYPIRNYEDLSRRWQESYTYTFTRRYFNDSLPELITYTNRLLGGDTRQRYTDWLSHLNRIFTCLADTGVRDVIDLCEQVNTSEQFEGFVISNHIDPIDLINVLKYLVYWYIPAQKPMRQLYRSDPHLDAILGPLRQAGIRSNLDLIERGATPAARQALAAEAGVSLDALTELVHRADFSRLPWASAATISNFIGAGYPSLAQFSAADFERVSADFFRWGASIGKNLKFGNEIDNSHRIARIARQVVE